ncbi:MAG: hypothetical protein LBQ83_03200 [Candidatus Margulisbacteria bacterium]|jgi:hypothetical protein|nr:hypothetical protein [Candidatus Margulisiibacteriota bacterium]
MSNNSRLRILIILLIFGLIGGSLGAVFALAHSGRFGSGRAAFSEDLAVRQAAGNYLQAWQDGAPDRMYVYLSELDRARVSETEYRQHFEAFPVAPLHFKLGTVQLVAADRATIQARIMWPELAEEGALDKAEQLVLVKENSVWRIREDESLN